MFLGASGPAPPATCLRALPPSPALALPVPVSLDAGCARVVLGPGRRVRLSARPRVTYPPGAQSAPGNGVTLRNGHVVWVRGGRVLWRSRMRFHAGHHRGVFTNVTDATSSGFRLAYVVSRWKQGVNHPLLFVTGARGRERLISRTASPLGWTPRGVITAQFSRRRVVLRVWRVDGRPAAPAITLAGQSWAWDWSANRLYAAIGGQVVRSDGVSITPIARLAALGLRSHATLTLSPLGNGLIELSSQTRLIVLDSAGRARVNVSLPAGWRLAGSVAAAPSGAVAFEATPAAAPLPARSFRLYSADPGGSARLLDHYSVPPACAPDGLWLRGRALLLMGRGIARVYDTSGTAPPVNLEPAVDWLRARHRTGQPSFS